MAKRAKSRFLHLEQDTAGQFTIRISKFKIMRAEHATENTCISNIPVSKLTGSFAQAF